MGLWEEGSATVGQLCIRGLSFNAMSLRCWSLSFLICSSVKRVNRVLPVLGQVYGRMWQGRSGDRVDNFLDGYGITAQA